MKITAVDYLSATTVICTDKTGTLTEGKMTGSTLMGCCRDSSEGTLESSLAFYPLKGLSPNGGLFEASKLTDERKKRMDERFDSQALRQAFAEPGLPDLAEEQVNSEGLDALMARAHLACSFLTCYGTSLYQNCSTGTWDTCGNMTEAALKVAAAKGGYWDMEGQGAELLRTHARVPDLEVPFTSKRKMMSTIHELPSLPNRQLASLQFPQDSTHFAILKGAPDEVLPRLGAIPKLEKEYLAVPGLPMSAKDRALLEERNADLAKRALRSLLLAVRPLRASDVEALRCCSSADDRLEILLKDPTMTCALSLWGIYDPPRASVASSIQACHEAGIRVIMITGDQKLTACAIARQIGILKDTDPDSCAALCSELHENCLVRVSAGQRKLSRRASDLLSMYALPDLPVKVEPEIPRRRLSSSKRLSVHDRRGARDLHEPEFRSEEELAELTSRVSCFARAQPTDKVAIVVSLMAQGHIAAMTGDGVNDAPALTAADVGVSMGIVGTAVTQNASDLVLMDDNFSTIVEAIREGRRIYSNIQKYVVMNLSMKFGEMITLMLSICLGVITPIKPNLQLLNIVVTHMLCMLSYATEKPEPYIMKVPPRRVKGDLVITKTLMLCKWLPFVLFFPTVVYGSLLFGTFSEVGFVTNQALVGSSQIHALDAGEIVCEHAGVGLSSRTLGHFIADAM